jgi:glutamate-1-semialdehyde 2,1-aminomutase
MTSKNQQHYLKAQELIPWATQTNAKRYKIEQDPMPPFIDRGLGCRIWDLDDKEYIDYRCSLGPILLGHRHPAVEEAVHQQMEKGVLFSMAAPVELEAAEGILQNIQWAEQIHFMKTGNDANSCCVRLSRSLTGREHILSVGYHGYNDWFACHWPHSGVPDAVRSLVHEVAYGQIEQLESTFAEYGSQIACAVVEPYDWSENPGHDFVKRLRQLCDRYGSLLVFDEILTGFRMALGGAAAFYGVTPDFSAFAKALANGYPLSAFVGKREVMSALNRTVLTTTHSGETLSLAACRATMQVLRAKGVYDHLYAMGRRLREGFSEICREYNAPAVMTGLEVAQTIRFNVPEPENVKMYDRFYSLLYQHGIFANVRWFISLAHQPADIDETLDKMRMAMKEVGS